MKRTFTLPLLLFAAIGTFVPLETAAPESAREGTARVEEIIGDSYGRRVRVNRVGMMVLGGWSLAHLGVSSAMLVADEGDHAFHEMNAAWSGVNILLAGTALWASSRSQPPESLAEEIEAQHRIEKILLINAGLDVGYVAAGALMVALGEAEADRRLRGWGSAVMVQGGFLLLFDVVLAAIQAQNRRYEVALPQ